jgi:hypothetical protein
MVDRLLREKEQSSSCQPSMTVQADDLPAMAGLSTVASSARAVGGVMRITSPLCAAHLSLLEIHDLWLLSRWALNLPAQPVRWLLGKAMGA